jgi:hypothetical protein
MFKEAKSIPTLAIAVAATGMMTARVWAGYSLYGPGMDVQTGTVANGQLQVQCVNNLWSGTAGSGSPTNTYTNTFAGFACDDYAKAWLVTTIYGGSNLNTAKITASVNGNTIAFPTVGNPGGVNDANPNVYGSSVAGIWVLSLPVDPSYLNKGSAATNAVSVVVSDKTQGATAPFDGRCYYQTLVTITQNAGLNKTLDYAFAAGGGDIGQTSGGYVISRTLNLGAIGSQPISQADLYALYIYGDANQKDALLLNGSSLLGDDVAKKNGSVAYPADFVYASVPTGDLLTSGNLLKFTVDPADFPQGSTLEASLRPEMAVLGVTHSVPEPASLSVLAMGASLLLMRSRQRR